MIHYLLLYQFTLLYCFTVVMGLVVYGSDFDSTAGRLYLLPLVVVPLLHRYLDTFARRLTAPPLTLAILLAGTVLALWAYRPLHFSYWDEHDLQQAVLLALLGPFSYLAGVVASARLQHWQGNHQRAAAAAWLILALVWIVAVAYPMVPLLAMAMIMAVATLWDVPAAQMAPLKQAPPVAAAGIAKYLVFLAVLELSLVIWDFQVDSRWGWQLAGAFITAALGCWLAFRHQYHLFWLVMTLVCLSFIATIVWPPLVIQPLHSAVVGLCLGWTCGYLLQGGHNPKPVVMLALAGPWFLGMIIGYLFYANLAYAPWRAVLLVPLLVWLVRKAVNTKTSAV